MTAQPFSWWGDWFPRGGPFSWWAGWFPEPEITDTVPGTTPGGVDTLLLEEAGASVTYAWWTGMHKAYDGRERRDNKRDDPAISFNGNTLLTEAQVRSARIRMVRFAAIGQPFLLALPYEELTVRSDSTGTVVDVQSTAKADWAVKGGRVLVRHALYGSKEAIVQDIGANSITLDAALGNIGRLGATIMPTFPIFLEPKQDFARYPVRLEKWAIKARNAVGQLRSVALKAELSLAPPKTTGVLAGAKFQARLAGTAGNNYSVRITADSFVLEGEVQVVGTLIRIKFDPGFTLIQDIVSKLAFTPITLVGTYNDTDILTAVVDELPVTALAGGADSVPNPVGLGAVVNTFRGVPIWDRGIDSEGTTPDSLQSMAEVLDFGGLPFAAGMAAVSDWGRDIRITRRLDGEWQWFKKFLDTVKGRWKSFWLPTYRNDLAWVSSGVGTITITSASDIFAWWPATQKHLFIDQQDGTKTYARITAAVNGGANTVVTLVDGAGAALTLSASPVTRISFLERCRLEADEVTVTFANKDFSSQLTARVVQQDDEDGV